ncbi:hypothetical protein I3760_08G030200 [Carya illinoinensis]|uniref:Uncharacterized protein n=1 Tax=Carya illinoinensis TaxID=32201 RepID=A0A8T1PUS8_CARIL|nr:uncharacterized protein LOC122319090 [Carya illinoinensis]KAG2691945.1 hypothetical protein I3760_08G030200 [Carya illinoinensis]KAG2691946.1 hypothetical protein I3760_08G030200 [Carya illinoinensis]KAG6644060.1 hypothetical protein CIPAW_08G029500 [Carya illinoinensis]
MEAVAYATNTISLKLFIDKRINRVLFAEAGKDFVEFLFQSFTLPVGYSIPCSSASMNRVVSLSVEELISANKAISNFNLLKEWVKFIVMDDLRMMPVHADTFITLLHEYDIKDLRALEKIVVDLDMDGSVKLLKAALQSKTALTDVFLPAALQSKTALPARSPYI